MVVGLLPFADSVGGVTDVFFCQRNVVPVRPSDRVAGLPPALETVILKALSKRPEDRFQTAVELSEALSSLAAPTNLPRPITAFVGREAAVAAATDTVRSSRLVTLFGPGGIGKTRLAIAVASAMGDSCTSGCSTALADSLSEVWGFRYLRLQPLITSSFWDSPWSSVFGRGIWRLPRGSSPCSYSGLGSLALSVFLGLYAWFVLDVVCEYCCLLYVASVGVFLSARLLNPVGVLRGLLNGIRRVNVVGLTLMVVAGTAFLALVLVQKRLWNDYAAEVLRASDLDCGERLLQRLPETHFKLASEAEPEAGA